MWSAPPPWPCLCLLTVYEGYLPGKLWSLSLPDSGKNLATWDVWKAGTSFTQLLRYSEDQARCSGQHSSFWFDDSTCPTILRMCHALWWMLVLHTSSIWVSVTHSFPILSYPVSWKGNMAATLFRLVSWISALISHIWKGYGDCLQLAAVPHLSKIYTVWLLLSLL